MICIFKSICAFGFASNGMPCFFIYLIYFTINNQGEIIPADELSHVFERFYRTNKERKVGGHGLGLSIAKKKCDMIGCKLSVESNEDDGTTFTIALKARKQK